ncbi:S46 family peptidase [bacterium SCSIO 12741]|nr:S46 family peptidase [bacterium SCSIO 12741]
MLKKVLVAAILVGFLGLPEARSDEGMWLPMFIKRLNYADMQEKGLKLTPDEIYSVNSSSLKDAIVGLGRPAFNFCSGEIVSSQGLFITNHHCGYGTIQANSTVEHNYLKDGFWAMNKGEEIPAGFSISILDHMEDVTATVLAAVNDNMDETQRAAAIAPIMDSLQKANSGEGMQAVVKSFFKGNEYYMFVYQVFPDVRLVGAPPSSIGKFGGDTDNWMWPRHTGDFTLFRIYAGKDNKPAAYSEDNVPYKPKHHLPVNIKGLNEGDYAMIWGFPGRTQRYLSSYGIEHMIYKEYPTRIKVRRMKLDLYEEGMARDEATRIKYSSKHAGVSNYWKNFIGMSTSLEALDVAGQKRAQEKEFSDWVAADSKRQEKYGSVLMMYQNGYDTLLKTQKKRDLYVEGIWGIEILTLSAQFMALDKLLASDEVDPKALDGMIQQIKGAAGDFYKDYDAQIDQNVMAAVMKMYGEEVPAELQAEYFKTLDKKYKGNYEKLAADVFKKSFMANEDKMNAFFAKASSKSLSADPAFKMFKEFYMDYMTNTSPVRKVAGEQLARAERLYIDAIRQINPDKSYYPDANSTLRFTYGNVGGYVPRDATYFKYFTTAQGILEKYKPGDLEFDAPAQLIEMIKNKDYGRYAKDGDLVVCFLSNNDITGGNSGSPVINGEGHLIGTAFDGNWEAMSGDVDFEENLQRTISVDIRYTLFIIDKFAGAGHLVDEMTVIE